MPADATEQPASNSHPQRLRFSLLTLFLVVTAACVACYLAGLMYWNHGCEAVASFRVSSQPSSLPGAGQLDAREFEIFCRSQISLLRNPWLLQRALRSPAVASLPILAGNQDPVAWLADALIVDFPQQGEILTIGLRGTRNQVADVRALVDAIATAYREEVVYRDRLQKMAKIHSLNRLVRDLRDQVEKRIKEVPSNSADPVETSPATKMQQMEFELLLDNWRDASNRLEMLQADLQFPPRVELLHGALVKEW